MRNDEIDVAAHRGRPAHPPAGLAGPLHARRGRRLARGDPRLRRAPAGARASASATRPSARPSAAACGAPRRLVHGKTDRISHDGRTVFRGLPQPFVATRYHSLVVDPELLARCLELQRLERRRRGHGRAPPRLPSRACSSTPRACSPSPDAALLANFLALRGWHGRRVARSTLARPPALDRRALERTATMPNDILSTPWRRSAPAATSAKPRRARGARDHGRAARARPRRPPCSPRCA